MEWIEKSRQPELAEQYDYYYVPTNFCDNQKLYDAHPSESYADCKTSVKAALEAVLDKYLWGIENGASLYIDYFS